MVVRANLMTKENYTPYCGVDLCFNRTRFDGNQFCCDRCGWRSQYPQDFINEYKTKWGK